MPKICLSCRHYTEETFDSHFTELQPRVVGFCTRTEIMATRGDERFGRTPLMIAREICDKEWDGHFVYFEPKPSEPPAGGQFAGELVSHA